MFRGLIVLLAILLHIFAASAHVTLAAPKASCKVSSDCKHFGHDQVDCIQGKCITFQHPHKKRAGRG
ncbi:hypothetical protein CAEBREN_04068 [Caenorhabditis brenneri]|uniref:Uncharacterized protein n=1 Tax=Caenorhabditis brenneri TaxID=135651 RepID=G0NFQ0_CAEBE|nr:hypothetical protein CAEBREN_04834 [Caenorhabditis brenneri]EGT59695.1 hypothetical protein CAEBREN_04068 [Caenorhabditis brenneri]